MANEDTDLIAMADEYGRAVENYTSAYDQLRALKGKLKGIEEKLEEMPAQTAAGIEAKLKAALCKARYSDNEAIVKSVASDAAQMAGRVDQ